MSCIVSAIAIQCVKHCNKMIMLNPASSVHNQVVTSDAESDEKPNERKENGIVLFYVNMILIYRASLLILEH